MKNISVIVKQLSKVENKFIDIRPIRSNNVLYVRYVIRDIVRKKNISLNDLKVCDMVSGEEYSVYSF